MVRLLAYFGLCSRLIRFPNNEIVKARLQVQQQELDKLKKRIDWGRDVATLLPMDWATIQSRVENGEKLVVIDGIVHKIDDFVNQHPGGEKILEFWNGRDATRAFHGEVYRHSKNANNLLAHFRIAKLQEKLE